ncbi:MAG: hypothetical protein FWF20_07095 [Betaproteobacteria bacterium]|nr:hypothetical protein [Betaproteobacteria bacterium]MCL2886535.1 hypothetical protein [Betaproteobacteria bacterium]
MRQLELYYRETRQAEATAQAGAIAAATYGMAGGKEAGKAIAKLTGED